MCTILSYESERKTRGRSRLPRKPTEDNAEDSPVEAAQHDLGDQAAVPDLQPAGLGLVRRQQLEQRLLDLRGVCWPGQPMRGVDG